VGRAISGGGGVSHSASAEHRRRRDLEREGTLAEGHHRQSSGVGRVILGHLLVRFKIPLVKRLNDSGAPLIFSRWIPIGPENGMHYDQANYLLVLWFNLACINRTANLAQMRYIKGHTIFADIIMDDVDDEFLHYMTVRDYSRMPTPEEESLAQRYEEHGRAVLSFVQAGLNRLLTYVRIEKGQYWLTRYGIDFGDMASLAVHFQAQACIDNGPWFRWQPSQSSRVVAIALGEDQRYLTAEDWPHAQDFLENEEKRPNLICELLVGSEFLADVKSNRPALTEAISALEAAVHRFAKSPRADALLPNALRERLGITSLSTLMDQEHLGFSRFVAYLLPILFTEEEVPATLLKHCRDAIEQRHQIMHGQQRQVNSDRLKQYLTAVRTLCETLMRWTVT
jgi:hypothetical protein